MLSWHCETYLQFLYENLYSTKVRRGPLAAIRNYRKGFPDSYPNLLYYAQELFDKLTDMP